MGAQLDRDVQEAGLTIFARFHARPGREAEVAVAIAAVVSPSRDEPGCLAIEGYRDTADPRLFFIHSLWCDEAAFELHAGLPHTVRFLETVRGLVDHDLEVRRAQRLRAGPS